VAVRYPGRLDRLSEPCVEDMGELADAVTDALVPLLDRPLSLFGHSMGSSVAYEVARRLETRHGFTPSQVFVSGRLAPHVAQHDDEDFDGSTDDALVASVRELGNGDGGAFDIPELREFILPALRADYRLINSYRPTNLVKIAAPLVGYAGLSDPGCPIDGMKAWSELTLGGFELRVFPGDHFFLVPERAAVLADLVPRLG
jgi:surfactin synthase thioesterase subunit